MEKPLLTGDNIHLVLMPNVSGRGRSSLSESVPGELSFDINSKVLKR